MSLSDIGSAVRRVRGVAISAYALMGSMGIVHADCPRITTIQRLVLARVIPSHGDAPKAAFQCDDDHVSHVAVRDAACWSPWFREREDGVSTEKFIADQFGVMATPGDPVTVPVCMTTESTFTLVDANSSRVSKVRVVANHPDGPVSSVVVEIRPETREQYQAFLQQHVNMTLAIIINNEIVELVIIRGAGPLCAINAMSNEIDARSLASAIVQAGKAKE